jgi:hypothetical protein
VAQLCTEFHWAPDFWHRMGWMVFWAWVRELRDLREERSRQHTADPDSWSGAENDQWWAQASAKRERMRGR